MERKHARSGVIDSTMETESKVVGLTLTVHSCTTARCILLKLGKLFWSWDDDLFIAIKRLSWSHYAMVIELEVRSIYVLNAKIFSRCVENVPLDTCITESHRLTTLTTQCRMRVESFDSLEFSVCSNTYRTSIPQHIFLCQKFIKISLWHWLSTTNLIRTGVNILWWVTFSPFLDQIRGGDMYHFIFAHHTFVGHS